jgi:hypothetical protein
MPANLTIYLLRPVPGAEPWEPWYDKAFGFIVAATDEASARACVLPAAGSEVARDRDSDDFDDDGNQPVALNPWLDPALSTCVAVGTAAPSVTAGVIMRDFARG